MAFQEDTALIAALTSGDEAAFVSVFEKYHASLVRVAKIYVNEAEIAEEVVQETWIAVLKGLSRFEGRSSLKTWIFSIMVNRAKTYAQREGRYTLFAAEAYEDSEAFEPAVPPDRFRPIDSKYAGHWISIPQRPDEIPESRLLSQEVRLRIEKAIETLPARQREVITLRDVEQISSEDVCNILGVSETNQRVLLHRARSQVRRALEDYLDD